MKFAGFAQPPAEPADEAVSLLVAETRSRGRDYLALSVTGWAELATYGHIGYPWIKRRL
jgi:hypothetical protein